MDGDGVAGLGAAGAVVAEEVLGYHFCGESEGEEGEDCEKKTHGWG